MWFCVDPDTIWNHESSFGVTGRSHTNFESALIWKRYYVKSLNSTTSYVFFKTFWRFLHRPRTRIRSVICLKFLYSPPRSFWPKVIRFVEVGKKLGQSQVLALKCVHCMFSHINTMVCIGISIVHLLKIKCTPSSAMPSLWPNIFPTSTNRNPFGQKFLGGEYKYFKAITLRIRVSSVRKNCQKLFENIFKNTR